LIGLDYEDPEQYNLIFVDAVNTLNSWDAHECFLEETGFFENYKVLNEQF